jgi:predicted nucleic acid-binding protein
VYPIRIHSATDKPCAPAISLTALGFFSVGLIRFLAHWDIFKRLCPEAEARGTVVPDAWFAALAIESGCEWVTLDRDYARFAGLQWRLPP